ncbi:hypothetical protein [Streptomyces platensis]|uniref:hypothetical protein n=1 Tax=Streptomyces platensis TaxID=58346 RepID=UPI003796A139
MPGAQSLVAAMNLATPTIAASAPHPSPARLLWIVDTYVLVFAGLLIRAGAASVPAHRSGTGSELQGRARELGAAGGERRARRPPGAATRQPGAPEL